MGIGSEVGECADAGGGSEGAAAAFELAAEAFYGAVDAFASGIAGDAECGGDFGEWERAIEAEEDGFAVFIAEGGEGVIEDGCHIAPGLGVLFLGRCVHGVEGMTFAMFAAVGAEEVAGLEAGGGVEPSGEGGAGLEAACLACEEDEGVLGGFVGDGGIAAGAEGALADEAGVAIDQTTERFFFPGIEPGAKQFTIVGEQVHCLIHCVRCEAKPDRVFADCCGLAKKSRRGDPTASKFPLGSARLIARAWGMGGRRVVVGRLRFSRVRVRR